ncbi:GNAT family N-acetyltransferase [Pseudohalioglobus sediminis]|uniref:GNAT family N-acetyltransferase n=1 Tax=Pseudohalioglobus sediminis TaxID=2606449 RepID=A0A5B0X281_9GAMM|nr:GNAT family N-acetyltransferase [Pseudohalioglobus sediminis]KAA1193383.1 GNAT family N-acetyltransferase [Pseudohalioglobus sediminis]
MDFSLYKDNFSRFGLAKGSYSLAYAGTNKLFYFKVLQGMTITMEDLDPKFLDIDERFSCGFLTPEELRLFAEDESCEMPPSFVEDALSRGDQCFGIKEGEVLASYGWYSVIPTPISDELELHFNGDWTYMYKGYTRSSHRGQRLHAVGMALALEAFTKQGAKGLISYVETSNYRSLHSCERMGYRNFGKVTIAKPFGKYIIRAQKACTPYGFYVKQIAGESNHSAPEPGYRDKQGA